MAKPDQAPAEIDVEGQGGAMVASDQYQDFPVDPAEEQQRTHADIAGALAGVIGKLQGLADRQVQLKQPIEQRWLDDMRQFHGRYPVKTEQDLKAAHKSKLFVNITRAKVNAWEARLTDLLFPTDDKNWGIKPVPQPHLSAAIRDSIQIANQAASDATMAHQAGNPELGAKIAAQGQTAVEAGVSIQQEIEAAERSADLMEQEIDSQLKDADYNIRCREVIRSSIKLGTGILKGPVTNNRLKRAWIKESEQKAPATQSPFANFRGRSAELTASQTALSITGAAPGPAPDGFSPANDAPATGGMMQQPQDLRADLPTYQPQPAAQPAQPVNLDAQAQGTGYVLDLQPDPAPEGVWVDPWSYFPDMSSNRVENKEFDFERHLWNAKQLRAAVRESGLDPEAVSRLLREGARTAMPTYWAQLREITSNSNISGTEMRFHVWEFTGVLEDEDLQALADFTKDPTVIEFVRDNPLLEVPVIIWFCQGELLKFAPYPLDSCESIYSIFNFEEDDTSLFGFGVPYLMRDSQSALNGAWRMMMDNGGLSVGPQIVVDNSMVQPADGDWGLRSMKVWLKNSSSLTTKLPDSYKPFEAIQITANQAQLQAIIALAESFADKETNMPLIAEGGAGGASITKTTGGMSMLMNAANVVFRRVVRNYDDTISSPFIRRMYDWNMQFNKRDDIKGNYAIDARGSSVLLVKEMQTQTLMSALQNFGAHPVFGPMLKGAGLLRQLFAAQMIRADDAVKSDDEIKQDAQARAQAAAQAQPQTGKSQAELAADVQMNRDNNLAKVQVAGMEQKTALIVLAGKLNMDVKKLQAELAINDADIQHRERLFAAELATQTPENPPHNFAGPGIKV